MLGRLTSNKTALRTLILLALLLSIVPFLILTFFCHPAFDDFCNTANAIGRGFIEWQVDMYNNSFGRYFLTAILYFNPLVFGSFAGYKAFALLIILLTFVSIFSFVDALLNSSFSRVDKLIAASFLMALFCNQMPEVTEAYYFMSGAMVYQLPTIMSLFFFALVIRARDKSKRVKLLLWLLSCILVVAIVGSSETSMLILALLVFAITITMWIAKSAQRWPWLVFLIVTIVCGAVVILAPGNAIRGSNFPGRHRFFYSLGMSLRQEFSFLLIWFSNFAFVLGTFFFIPVATKLADRIPGFKHLRVHPLISSLLLLLLVFLGLFPAYWNMGMMAQHRTVTTAYFFFLIGWFINIVIWMDHLKRKRGFTPAKLPDYVYVIGVPLLLCTLLFTNNTKVAIADLVRGRAYRYDQAIKKRYVQFEQCAREGNVDNCAVERITDLPTTITNPYYETQVECEKLFWKAKAQSSSPR
jgi:hypothetical protein